MQARAPDDAELRAWLRLLECPGLGRTGARRLLAGLGGPQEVLASAPSRWAAHVDRRLAAALEQPPAHLEALLERTRHWLAQGPDRSILVLGDEDYPPALLATEDPPLLLYLWGRRELLHRPSLAIVGSRNASNQGCENARAFAQAFSEAGLCVVSGLALGIDAAAHEGALMGAGSTMAILGTGLDQLYPRANLKLAHRIADQGLLISELSLGTPPLPPNFPVRNRLIAGLSQGCLVIEAALQSGSLITARLAAEAGREVFAIPGSIHSPMSHGCHALIRQGAKLVERAADVLEELPPLFPGPPASPRALPTTAPAQPTCEAATLLSQMGYDPVNLDTLLARSGWSTERLSALLLDLELDGLVSRLPGGSFQRRAPA